MFSLRVKQGVRIQSGDSISPMTARACAHTGVWGRLVLLLGLAIFSAGVLSAQVDDDGPVQPRADTSRPRALTNDMIVRMVKAGLDEPIILQTVQTQPGRYDTAPDDLIALKDADVPPRVILAMQAKASGLTTHPDITATTGGGPSALALGLEEIGVYYKDKAGDWVPLKTEKVALKSSG